MTSDYGPPPYIPPEQRQPAQPAGWYPDQKLRKYKRWWNGERWTERVVSWQETPAKQMVKRVGLAIGLVLLVPVILLTLNGTSVGGVDCGSWLGDSSQRDFNFTMTYGSQGGDLLAAACNEKVSDQRNLILLLIGLGVGARVASWVIASKMDDVPVEEKLPVWT